MNIRIRELLQEEAAAYVACHIACWREAYKGILSDEYLDTMLMEQDQRTERFKQSLTEPTTYTYYCALSMDEIVGRLVISSSRDEDKPGAGEICAIYLREAFWDKGYGRQMMNYAADLLTHKGYKEIVLWVLEENSRARDFYERCGFLFDGTKKGITIDRPRIEMRYARIVRDA